MGRLLIWPFERKLFKHKRERKTFVILTLIKRQNFLNENMFSQL